jgi:hypothetical protein
MDLPSGETDTSNGAFNVFEPALSSLPPMNPLVAKDKSGSKESAVGLNFQT